MEKMYCLVLLLLVACVPNGNLVQGSSSTTTAPVASSTVSGSTSNSGAVSTNTAGSTSAVSQSGSTTAGSGSTAAGSGSTAAGSGSTAAGSNSTAASVLSQADCEKFVKTHVNANTNDICELSGDDLIAQIKKVVPCVSTAIPTIESPSDDIKAKWKAYCSSASFTYGSLLSLAAILIFQKLMS